MKFVKILADRRFSGLDILASSIVLAFIEKERYWSALVAILVGCTVIVLVEFAVEDEQ